MNDVNALLCTSMQLLDAMRNVASASGRETLVKRQVLDVISATLGTSSDDSTVNTPGVTETLVSEAMDVITGVIASSKQDVPDLIDSFGLALSNVAVSLDNNARNPGPSATEAKASNATEQFGALATGLCEVLVSNSLDGEKAVGAATNSLSLSCKKDAVNSAGTISIKPLSLQPGDGGTSDGPAHGIQLSMGVQAEYSATFVQGPPGAFTAGAGTSARRRRLADAVRKSDAVAAAELRMHVSSLPHSAQKLRTSMRVELSPEQACGGNRRGCSVQNLHGDVHLRSSKRRGVLSHINFVDNGAGGLIQKFYTAEMLASEATTVPLFNTPRQASAGWKLQRKQSVKPRRGVVAVTVIEHKSVLVHDFIQVNEVQSLGYLVASI